MTEATVVFAMGIFILIPFSLARSTCVRTPSTVFPSARSKSLDLTEKRVHESDEECGVFRLSSMHPSPMSYSSTSTLSDSVMNLRIVPALELPSHPRQVNCWFHTTHQTFLTTRQFKFAQQSPPSSQIHFECACTAQLGPEAKRLFRNRILRRSGSTSGYPRVPLTGCPRSCLISFLQCRRHPQPPLHGINLPLRTTCHRERTPSTSILRFLHPQLQNTSHSFASSSASSSYDRRS